MQSKELLLTALQQSYGLVMPLLEGLKSAPLIAAEPSNDFSSMRILAFEPSRPLWRPGIKKPARCWEPSTKPICQKPNCQKP